jgi:DNA topoisomerase VI subunit A
MLNLYFFRIADEQLVLIEGKKYGLNESKSNIYTASSFYYFILYVFVGSLKKASIFMKVVSTVHELLITNKRITKRDLFYMDIKLFEKQVNSDRAVEDLSQLLNVPRSMLNVFASPKGLVCGKLNFEEDGKNQSADTRGYLLNPLGEYRSFFFFLFNY